MKTHQSSRTFDLIVLHFACLLCSHSSNAQCPESGLKIITNDCESPQRLAIKHTNCNEMNVTWTGNANQTYLVKATAANPSSNQIINLKVSQSTCDNNGKCTANIEVVEGVTINWSVQAICAVQGAEFYSDPVAGPEKYIPPCEKKGGNTGLLINPNPSSGLLTVTYSGEIKVALQVTVYDASGKKVFAKREASLSGNTNQYELNLQALSSGTYLLETVNGSEKKQTKFVLVRQ